MAKKATTKVTTAKGMLRSVKVPGAKSTVTHTDPVWHQFATTAKGRLVIHYIDGKQKSAQILPPRPIVYWLLALTGFILGLAAHFVV